MNNFTFTSAVWLMLLPFSPNKLGRNINGASSGIWTRDLSLVMIPPGLSLIQEAEG